MAAAPTQIGPREKSPVGNLADRGIRSSQCKSFAEPLRPTVTSHATLASTVMTSAGPPCRLGG